MMVLLIQGSLLKYEVIFCLIKSVAHGERYILQVEKSSL